MSFNKIVNARLSLVKCISGFCVVAYFAGSAGISLAQAYGFDYHGQEALRDARNDLLKKEDYLREDAEALKRDVANMYAELKRKTDELNQVESELVRTHNALQDVERNIVR